MHENFNISADLGRAIGRVVENGPHETSPDAEAARVDLALADLIESDAADLADRGEYPTLERYLTSWSACGVTHVEDVRRFPIALEAAILAAIGSGRGSPSDLARDVACDPTSDVGGVQDRAFALAIAFPSLRDEILAVALALGISEEAPDRLKVGDLAFGRWRVTSLLGDGTTATTAIARDELLSTADNTVEVVLKRYDDREGEARAHALRELRAMVAAPARTASRPLAMHAPPGAAAHLVVLYEASLEMEGPDDVATAVDVLARLHAAGVAHGDLKPDHIRVRPDGSVFFIDFGCSTSASDEAIRSDLARLAETASPHLPHVATLSARAALARGRTGVARHALHAFAPRVVRRRARKALIALAVIAVTPLAGFAFGRWVAAPIWREAGATEATKLGDELGVLAKTGRLVGATVGPHGRLESITLHIHEWNQEPKPGSTLWTMRKPEYFRLLPNGGVDWKFVDEAPLVLEEAEIRRRWPSVLPRPEHK